MADLIRLTLGLKTLTGAGPFLQLITEVVDVSMVLNVNYIPSLTTITSPQPDLPPVPRNRSALSSPARSSPQGSLSSPPSSLSSWPP